jgi:23S rRNA pseudouridine1911/1915/1917 synthase
VSERRRSFTAPPDAARIRLDRYLAGIFPEESRSQIQGWIRSGEVLVNGSLVKTGYRLQPGDDVSVQAHAAAEASQPAPENIPIPIIFEDEDLAVVDKPAGMVTHAGAGVRSGTLVNALLYHLGPVNTGDPLRPGIVHRLDKLTSGLLVVAKNLRTHRALARQFRCREVKKEYLALVYGHPVPPAATINLALGRDLRDRKKISVHSRRRRDAVTHYAEEQKIGPFSLLRIRIETGRTHQIRVHLAQRGHPVVGDHLYGGNRARNIQDAGLQAAVRALPRQFLHACRLDFTHPGSGARLFFQTPLPLELTDFLALVEDKTRART